ncbi:hypothetical protein JB92DRAFT_3104305 [Gautieria morchelliformis]|nr:hypothetical protein JB92DRAFT_3104305 [Gautieria morchelliformis]
MSTGSGLDTPNQGFVPPTQLRKSRPSLVAARKDGSEPTQADSRPQHSRTASFFSFSSKKSAQQQAQRATLQVAATDQRSPTSQISHMQSPPSSPTHTKRPSLGDALPMNANPTVQREIKSVIDLALAHAHKIYYSGPLVRRIERLPDGNRPVRDDGWVDVWAQLGGTTLSVWDMKAIEEASKRGEEVPPSYINVTDSFVQVLGALTSPATATAPAKRYTNVITINTAGSNLIFFACPSSAALVSWATSLRLASWEKARLEEIYTGHLLRMSLSENDAWKEPATTLVKGKLEGEVKVRIAGQTDWKPLWMVLSSSTEGDSATNRPNSPLSQRSKSRMSSLFARAQTQPPSPPAPAAVPVISFYPSQKSKDRKKPILTMRYVSQAFAVYPERPEVIQRSTLIKIEGMLGHEDLAGAMKGRECWMMLMPETQQVYPVFELLKWLVALHDTFSLYGRPAGYIWDPRQPVSMWFAYPVGAQRAQLFVDREAAEILDPRDDRTTAIRKELKQILITRMYGSSTPPGPPQKPTVQRQGTGSSQKTMQRSASVTAASATATSSFQLPPLSFHGTQAQQQQLQESHPADPLGRGTTSLSPITERSPVETLGPKLPSKSSSVQPSPLNTVTHSMPDRQDSASSSFLGGSSSTQERQGSTGSNFLGGPLTTSDSAPERQGSPSSSSNFLGGHLVSNPMPERQESGNKNFLGGPFVTNPTEKPSPHGNEDSPPGSRPDSKLAQSASYASIGFDNIDSSPQADSTSPRAKSPSISKSPTSVQLLHSPTESTSLTSNILSPTKAQSQSSAISRSSPSATASSPLHSPRVLSHPPEPPQARKSPPHNTVSSPSLSKPHTPGPPSPPPKSASGTPTLTNRASPQAPPAADATQPESPSDIANEAGALYLLQEQLAQAEATQPGTWTTDEDEGEDDDDHDSDFTGPERNPPPRRATPPVRIQPPSAYRHPDVVSENQTAYGVSRSMGRKPSGARAKPSSRRYTDNGSIEQLSSPLQSPAQGMEQQAQPVGYDDNADALAAFTFLETQEAPAPPQEKPPPSPEKEESSPQSSEAPHYPSTFAPSKQAAERKAKAQALQEASYAATHLPGKPNGNIRKKRKDQGAWAESSDEEEEEEEEEEDDDEDGSDDEPPTAMRQPQPVLASDPRASVYPSAQPGQQGPPSMLGEGHGQRQTRTLPLPPGKTGDHPDHHHMHPRVASGQHDDRPRTQFGDEPRGHSMNPHQVARQSVWSTVLDPNPPPRNTTGKDTFVQVEESETMTKAFQPQGLLSAGLQDKEDRSAKRQEELARETGASLINVPNKPPPPQTGLLGAITAHERERKREGGVGATLTEKERERRLAEERQRKLDELQRQQLDQMSQGGAQGGYDAYGQQQFPGFMPGFDPRMSMNPMMLNPYMAGGYPMMPFGNTQQMMAAQMAAQQAYQQAMMSFSQAGGSQMGDNMSRVGVPTPAAPSPQMGPPSPMQGGMMGMDPRMSMGMNPWMGGGMGMGMNPMGGGMGMAPMGMMDPRMSMGQQNFLQRPESGQGHGSPFQGPFQGTPSPRQGSPALRSNNNSPRPQPHT